MLAAVSALGQGTTGRMAGVTAAGSSAGGAQGGADSFHGSIVERASIKARDFRSRNNCGPTIELRTNAKFKKTRKSLVPEVGLEPTRF